MKRWYQKYNCSTISEVHASFANHSKIQLLIKKERLLRYQFGTSIEAVFHEWQLNHKDRNEGASLWQWIVNGLLIV